MGLFVILLTIMFIGLKITDNIDWEWIWVVSPLWISIALAIASVIVYFLTVGIILGISFIIKLVRGK